MSGSYEDDILLWSEQQANLLRRHAATWRSNDPIDWPNIIEEIESVGRAERSALSSHVRIILEHLLKLETSPATEPRGGWTETIIRARADVAELLEESPSLAPTLAGVCARQLPRARSIVAAALEAYGEAPRVDVNELHYSPERVLGSWLPDPGK
jgi:hypothetical protein